MMYCVKACNMYVAYKYKMCAIDVKEHFLPRMERPRTLNFIRGLSVRGTQIWLWLRRFMNKKIQELDVSR